MPLLGECKDGVVTVTEDSQYAQWQREMAAAEAREQDLRNERDNALAEIERLHTVLRGMPHVTKNEVARLVADNDQLRIDIATLAKTASRKAEELEHLRKLMGAVEDRLRQETASNQDTPAITLDAIADTIGVALRPGWKPGYK
jgi:chromosome segregation ATPase